MLAGASYHFKKKFSFISSVTSKYYIKGKFSYIKRLSHFGEPKFYIELKLLLPIL